MGVECILGVDFANQIPFFRNPGLQQLSRIVLEDFAGLFGTETIGMGRYIEQETTTLSPIHK